ncbi:MAG: hypothetical protein KDB53_13395, partial [Planctomycetes bacterium]|nr:hypothetical protein [Planctomycetota bacterium]
MKLAVASMIVAVCVATVWGTAARTQPVTTGAEARRATEYRRLAGALGLEVTAVEGSHLVSDGDSRAEALLRHLNAARSFLAQGLGVALPRPGPWVFMVDAHDRRAELEGQLQVDSSRGELATSSAWFCGRDGSIHLRGDATLRDPWERWRLLAHESAHELMWRRGRPVATGPGAWINEGVALLLEALDPEDGHSLRPEAVERLAQARSLAESGLLCDSLTYLEATREQLTTARTINVSYPFRGGRASTLVAPAQVQGFAFIHFLHHALGARFWPWLRAALDH